MSDSQIDEQFLSEALDLAHRGIGLASPNPCVGAVIVDATGRVIGRGTHTYEGRKHAEIVALEEAGAAAKGSTVYLNLEPCSHVGRTGPCADALTQAGVKRVVACMPDPNPLVAGRGFEKLRNAGMQVDVGRLQREAQRLNEGFARYIRSRRPFLTLKSAMTLDGKIAPARRQDRHAQQNEFRGTWITGELARNHVQRLRHENDALLAGIGTALADNPMLSDRTGLPRRRPLLRVVLDSKLQIPLQSRLVQDARRNGRQDLLVICASSPEERKKAQLLDCGVQVEEIRTIQGQVDFVAVLRRLAELEITKLMIEGGSRINASALASGLVDKMFLFYAPSILGDAKAVPFASGEIRIENGDSSLKDVTLHRFGDDIAIEGYLRDPYSD